MFQPVPSDTLQWKTKCKEPGPQIFTVHKRSCGKVMFSQACVKNSAHGRGGTPPSQPDPLLQADDYCSGRYASYWNAYLYSLPLEVRTYKIWPHKEQDLPNRSTPISWWLEMRWSNHSVKTECSRPVNNPLKYINYQHDL